MVQIGHEKKTNSLRIVSLPRLQAKENDSWPLWRFPCSRGHTRSAGEKTVCGSCGTAPRGSYDRKTRLVRGLPCGSARVYLELDIRRIECRRCGTVKQEKLSFLADHPFYTKRFAFYVGRRCNTETVK